MIDMIKQLTDEIFEEAVLIRRQLHQIPELAFEEYQTADFIKQKLNFWQIPYQDNIAGTGIMAYLENGPGRCIAMRADMDALPIHEETDPPFRSKHSGKMHACGHDAHMAIVLATAYVLSKIKETWHGTIKFLFEPGEEEEGGARPMIAQGVLKKPDVDICLGIHVMNEVEVGTIQLAEGAAMAASDDFDLIIYGKSGHGGWPQDTVDPIVAACQVVNNLQTIVSREVEPQDAAVISIGSIHGGTVYNVIPDSVHLQGTVRSLKPETRERLPKLIERVANGVTAALGASCQLDYHFIYPPTINAPEVNRLVEKAVEPFKCLRIERSKTSSMGGDDFAFFAQQIPSCYIKLGSGTPQNRQPLHSSTFTIQEEVIRNGILTLAATTQYFLQS